MKRSIFALTFALLFSATAANAQSFLEILKSDKVKDVVENVSGGQKITATNISGTWSYKKPAVKLEGDNVLKNATGSLVSSQIENTLSNYCSKVGITSDLFSYTFNSDNSFYCSVKGKKLKGTYSIDSNTKTITMKFSIINKINLGTMKAEASLLGNSLSLLFNVDKLLDFVSKVTASEKAKSLNFISEAAQKYEGLLIGFELEK